MVDVKIRDNQNLFNLYTYMLNGFVIFILWILLVFYTFELEYELTRVTNPIRSLSQCEFLIGRLYLFDQWKTPIMAGLNFSKHCFLYSLVNSFFITKINSILNFYLFFYLFISFLHILIGIWFMFIICYALLVICIKLEPLICFRLI